jgi:hypothetical protein
MVDGFALVARRTSHDAVKPPLTAATMMLLIKTNAIRLYLGKIYSR